jgi:hypothetical protein
MGQFNSISFYLCMVLQPFCGPLPHFQFLTLYTVGRTPWTGDQPVARALPTRKTTRTQNKRIQTSMPQVGFEPTIPVFERAKTVHALDRAATVIGALVSPFIKSIDLSTSNSVFTVHYEWAHLTFTVQTTALNKVDVFLATVWHTA